MKINMALSVHNNQVLPSSFIRPPRVPSRTQFGHIEMNTQDCLQGGPCCSPLRLPYAPAEGSTSLCVMSTAHSGAAVTY